MTATNSVARKLWAVRQTLFPSFEAKAYHLQFRHGALIMVMLMCASFTLPANPQLKAFALSDYSPSADIPVESSYNLILRYIHPIMWYNLAVAAFIGLHLVVEPQFQRGAPVWYEMFWMLLVIIGEAVCLGLMGSSRPDVCDFHFGLDLTFVANNKITAKNSATSICSNWRGMTALLATIIALFLLHVTWHMIISIRHMRVRRSVFTLPITDYRWTLPRDRPRVNEIFPGDIEAPAPVDKHRPSADPIDFKSSYGTTTNATDTLSFPATASTDYCNYDRSANLDALPAKKTQPLILEQSRVTQSDTSSIAEESVKNTPVEAPFSNFGSRI